jgi:hemerythrin
MLVWDDKYETGQPVMDAQHRMLIAYVNRLHVLSLTQNPNHEDIAYFLHFVEFLEDYIEQHFRAEEECMLRLKCPAHSENCRAHHEFIGFFKGFRRRMKIEANTRALMAELHRACADWIAAHILRIDVRMKDSPPAGDDATGK